MRKKYSSLIVICTLIIAGACRFACAEQDPEKKTPEEQRQAAYEEFQKKNRDTLDKSQFYGGLEKAGLLDKAQAVEGPPPGIRFSMDVNGKTENLMLSLAHGIPLQPEQLIVMLEEGKPVEISLGEGGSQAERLSAAITSVRKGGAAAVRDVSSKNVDAAGPMTGKKETAALKKALGIATGLEGGAVGAISGGTGKDTAKKTAATQEFSERGKDGLLTWSRYEKGADGKITKVPVAKETADGVQFLQGSAGHEQGIERYSRTWNGEKAFMRVENGLPKITHVERDGQWVPLADAKVKEGFNKGQLVQEASDGLGGRARFAFEFNEKGQGNRTYQFSQVGKESYWLALEKGQPMANTAGLSRQVVSVGRMTAVVEFGADGSARATHMGQGSTLYLASGYGQEVKSFGQVVHEVKSSDGKADQAAYQFARGADGSFKGSMYAQQLRGVAADTWVAVDGKPLARPEGSQLQVLRSGNEKLLVRFNGGGASAEVLAGGSGALLGTDLSKVPAASFKAETESGGAGAKPASAFRYTFEKSKDGNTFTGRADEQRVDVGLGLSAWTKLADGKPLTGATMTQATQEARTAKIAELDKEVQAAQVAGDKKIKDGLAWYNSNPAVASRLAAVFASQKPAPVTTAEVRAAAKTGSSIAIPELKDSKGELVHHIGDTTSKAPARSVFMVVAGDKDAATQQAQMEDHKKIVEAWVKEPNIPFLERAQRLLAVPTMLPQQATVVMSSDRELQSQLDANVNPRIAAMPKVAAGVGISQDPGKAAYGAGRLDPSVPARRGGGGGPLGRLLNIPGRADDQIRGQAWANSGRAGSEMQQARTDAIGTVVAGVESKRLQTINQAETSFSKQGIKSVDIVDVANAKPQAGFSYKRDDGSRYLLSLNINESVLPKEPRPSALPGTPGQRLVMTVDTTLAPKAYSSSNGLSQKTIDTAWENAIRKQYGVDSTEAARIRLLIAGR